MKYLKKFDTLSEYQLYRESSDFIYPNASYIVEKQEGSTRTNRITGTPKLTLTFDSTEGQAFMFPKGVISSIMIDGEQIEITPEQYDTTETLIYGSEITLDASSGMANFPDSYVISHSADSVELTLQDPNLSVSNVGYLCLIAMMGSDKMCQPLTINEAIEYSYIELDVDNNVIRLTDDLLDMIEEAITYGGYYGFLLGEMNETTEGVESYVYDMKYLVTGVSGGLQSPYIVPNDKHEVVLKLKTDKLDEGWRFDGLVEADIKYITEIHDSVFSDNDSIQKITLPMGITSIGQSVFEYCPNLTSINIPDSVTSIGEYAFRGCSGLTSINIPDGVTEIGKSAFYGCKGLTSINIPDSVTSIGISAFSNCSNLTSINIPNSVKTIGNSAFASCSGLASIVIPDSVTSIDNYTFNSCTSLDSIVIPDSVTTIGGYAFYGCSGLTSIDIPGSVTSIGQDALPVSTLMIINCHGQIAPSISSHGAASIYGGIVKIPAGSNYSSWKSREFYNWKFIDENSNDKYIVARYGAYSGKTYFCQSTDWFDTMQINGTTYTTPVTEQTNTDYITKILYHLTKPAISENAFFYADTMEKIYIPDSVTSIGNYAFRYCSGLTSIDIPDSVTSIGQDAFADCKGLTEITLPDSVTSIGERAFASCLGLTSINIPDSVTSIGDHIFNNCSGLTSIDIPDSVKTIGKNAFWGTSLEHVTIPDSVVSIDKECFGGSALKSITFGSGLTSIGELAFYYCSNLTSITCYTPTAPIINPTPFFQISTGGTLYVPTGSDYSSWMKNEEGCLGYYGWTIQYI